MEYPNPSHVLVLAISCLAAACGDSPTPSDTGTDAAADTARDAADTGDTGDAADASVDPDSREFDPDCDPLVPEHCMLPFPSDYYEVPADTRTGRRIEFGETSLPPIRRGGRRGTNELFDVDGWSTNTTLIAYLPGATATGMPNPLQVADSLLDDSPTVLIDVSTGARVPHFSEIDASVRFDGESAILIQPVVPLEHDREYIVGIRGVVDDAGALVSPSESFLAYRDGGTHEHPRHAERAEPMENTLQTLIDAGYPRAELQLAWSFHTRSVEDATGVMLAMRDTALESLPSGGPEFRIDEVLELDDTNILREISGHLTVPLFLDNPEAGGRLTTSNPDEIRIEGSAEYPFIVRIPRAAEDGPLPVTQYGHGLLGRASQVRSSNVGQFANERGHVMIAMDWIGMASDDVSEIFATIMGEELIRFATVPDRLRQGFVNKMVMTRLIQGALVEHESMQVGDHSAIDPAEVYYAGESQGGIFGASLVALSPDIRRGVLGVPGQPYSLLLFRSVDFDAYFELLRLTYGEGPQIPLLIGLVQHFFDLASPGTYSRFIREPLPGSVPSEVLLQVAIADQQVSPLGAHVMARALGAPFVTPAVRSAFGIEESPAPHEGSGIVEYDFGNPDIPLINVPPREGDDPHGLVRQLQSAQAQRDVFLRTGVVENFCDGACDPE